MLEREMIRRVEARLRAVEERTGVQVVAAAIERADVYHGLRWRAFALMAALGGLIVALGGPRYAGWMADATAFFAAATVLGAGLVGALLVTLAPPIARLFLEPLRAEAEVRQRAAVIFLERELFATRDRTAVLLLVCGFERLAVVMPDSGLRARAREEEWRAAEDTMAVHLRARRPGEGLLAGLDALEQLLAAKGFTAPAGASNELPDRPLTGKDGP
jgi:putative membrane protein